MDATTMAVTRSRFNFEFFMTFGNKEYVVWGEKVLAFPVFSVDGGETLTKLKAPKSPHTSFHLVDNEVMKMEILGVAEGLNHDSNFIINYFCQERISVTSGKQKDIEYLSYFLAGNGGDGGGNPAERVAVWALMAFSYESRGINSNSRSIHPFDAVMDINK
ncbi:hypothetical protein E3N88_35748 [Mikania micrantha]|uniref:Uncharacterized protein n=1 Tax=Mikania micrantha TaxID=192012 RepID=A0A5N6M260_9ASTR|nr:hypothetical protein E3N88_35748 [Mikania micrantha]